MNEFHPHKNWSSGPCEKCKLKLAQNRRKSSDVAKVVIQEQNESGEWYKVVDINCENDEDFKYSNSNSKSIRKSISSADSYHLIKPPSIHPGDMMSDRGQELQYLRMIHCASPGETIPLLKRHSYSIALTTGQIEDLELPTKCTLVSINEIYEF